MAPPHATRVLQSAYLSKAASRLTLFHMASARLFRVIVPVSSIEDAAVYYSAILAQPGMRISPGRHYFDCGQTILACFDPRADGDAWDAMPNPGHLYFAVDDLEAYQVRASQHQTGSILRPIETQPWGERSFYCADPFGNKLCFVDERTLFTGR
jgi:predicted enzyme related to lactoylglutathione lyase